MWKCNKCEETHEDHFDSCWKCGNDKSTGIAVSDGKEEESQEEFPSAATLEEHIENAFCCAKCKSRDVRTKRLAVSGTGLSKLFDIQHNSYIACTCQNCSYTEFYDPEVLEGKKLLGTVLDLLFG